MQRMAYMAAMTDRLSLTRAFEDTGIPSAAAERIATEIYDAIHDGVATKADLLEVEQRLDLRFAKIEAQIDRVVVRLTVASVAALGVLFAALHAWPPH